MCDAHHVADDQAARIASTNPAGDRPLAFRRDRADAVLDLQLESARAADGGALQPRPRQVNVGPALGVGKRLDDRAMWSGLAHTSDEARAVDDDYAGQHPIVASAVDLKRAAEGVGPTPDHSRDHGPVTKGSLELERPAKLLVVVCGGIELGELPPQGLVFRAQPLVLSPQARDISEHRRGAPGG